MLRFFIMIVAALSLAGCGGKIAEKYFSKRGEYVVLINTFDVVPGKADEFVEVWEKARDFMREQDGYISTRLHQSLDQHASRRYVNVAHWQSTEQFLAATRALLESGIFYPIEGVIANPDLYKVVRKDR